MGPPGAGVYAAVEEDLDAEHTSCGDREVPGDVRERARGGWLSLFLVDGGVGDVDGDRVVERVGDGVEAAFSSGGVFTSFHVVGSSDVIVPKHVEAVFPGTTQPVTTSTSPASTRTSATS